MSKPKILIVDDDPKLSALSRIVLERLGGYEVREENRPFAAAHTARDFKPDLFILDVDMPGKDGGELAKELKRLPQFANTPILFVTSLYSGAQAGTVSGWQFLAKPVDPQRLVSTVRSLLPAVAA